MPLLKLRIRPVGLARMSVSARTPCNNFSSFSYVSVCFAPFRLLLFTAAVTDVPFQTKAMREIERLQKATVYRTTVIKVRPRERAKYVSLLFTSFLKRISGSVRVVFDVGRTIGR